MPEAPEETRPGAVVPVDNRLLERVETTLDGGEEEALSALLEELYPADIAELLGALSREHARRLFAHLPTEEAAEVLTELDGAVRERILDEAPHERLTEIIDELDTDDAADVLGDLEEHVALRILPKLEDADELRDLLLYAGDTAGGIMATEYVSVPRHWTVGEATEEVRRQAEHVDDVYDVFVTDRDDRLVGIVSLKRLLLSPSWTAIEAIMETDFISVEVAMDQEEVAHIMARYDIVSMPVVDRMGRLVGRITIDDVIDVLREEASEDLQVISGTSGDEGIGDSPFRIIRGRLPWLLLGLVGTILSASVVRSFEQALEQAIVLAFFIPIMTAMAGNAAIQSAAITVQGLASGKLFTRDAFKRIGKELAVALLNGAALAVLLSLAVIGFGLGAPNTLRLAGVASLALFIVITLATTNGALIPVVLDRLGMDPAVSMGPFVTTANDILGLTIYFIVATTLFL